MGWPYIPTPNEYMAEDLKQNQNPTVKIQRLHRVTPISIFWGSYPLDCSRPVSLGRRMPRVSRDPKACVHANQGVSRSRRLKRSEAYCAKKVSLVKPTRLAKKQKITIPSPGFFRIETESFQMVSQSLQLLEVDGLEDPSILERGSVSSSWPSSSLARRGSSLPWTPVLDDSLARLKFGPGAVSGKESMTIVISRYTTDTETKGTKRPMRRVIAVSGGAVNSLIESVRPKK